jgi:short-subunit dehydrogenase
MTKQIVLITGASSGIGLELSRVFAQNGYDLVLVARSIQKLEALASELKKAHGSDVTVLPFDLAQAGAAQQVFNTVKSRGLDIHILVNNAGFGIHQPLAQSDPLELNQMLQVDVVALTELTRLFLPAMLARKSGRILNVGSTGSFAPAPLMTVYAASKAYVLSFSEALSEELRGTGVTVTALCPGATPTGFQERAQVGNMPLVRMGLTSAQDVAAQGYRALMAGRRVVVPGFSNQLLIFLTALTPRGLLLRLTHRLMTK